MRRRCGRRRCAMRRICDRIRSLRRPMWRGRRTPAGRGCAHRLAVVGGDTASLAAALEAAARRAGRAGGQSADRLRLPRAGGAACRDGGDAVSDGAAVPGGAGPGGRDPARDAGARPAGGPVWRFGSRLAETAYAQPALVALSLALGALWSSWGIVPEWVLGHSIGEIAAASVAGLLDLEAALLLAARRGRLMQALPAGGGMSAVAAPWPEVASHLAGWPGVVLAADNGVETVLSGPLAALAGAEAALSATGLAVRRLGSGHAFHSALMAPAAAALEQEAAAEGSASGAALISTVTGAVVPASGLGAGYWARQALAPVRFAAALETLVAQGCTMVVELGPRPVLTGLGRRNAVGAEFLPSLDRGRGDWASLLDSLGRLYAAGAPVDWASVDAGRVRRRVALPGYPFQRTRHWVSGGRRRVAATAGDHPLLGRRLSVAPPAVVHEAALSAEAPGYLADHRVGDAVVAPAAALLEMALAAGRSALSSPSLRLEDVVFERPLRLGPTPSIVQTVLTPQDDGALAFVVSSQADAAVEGWERHASGRVRRLSAPADGSLDVASLREGLALRPDPYAGWAAAGFGYGPAFRTLRRLWSAAGTAVGEVVLEGPLQEGHAVHPAVLDGCVQTALAAAEPSALVLPYAVEWLELHGPVGARAWSRAKLEAARADGSLTAEVELRDAQGALALRIGGLTLRPQQAPAPGLYARGVGPAAAAPRRAGGWAPGRHGAGRRRLCGAGAAATGLAGNRCCRAVRGGGPAPPRIARPPAGAGPGAQRRSRRPRGCIAAAISAGAHRTGACCIVAGRPLATSCAARRTACRCCSRDGDADTLTRLYEGPVSIGSLERSRRPRRSGGGDGSSLPPGAHPRDRRRHRWPDQRDFAAAAGRRGDLPVHRYRPALRHPCGDPLRRLPLHDATRVLDIARPLEGQGVPLRRVRHRGRGQRSARDPGPGGDARSGACPVRRPMAPCCCWRSPRRAPGSM